MYSIMSRFLNKCGNFKRQVKQSNSNLFESNCYMTVQLVFNFALLMIDSETKNLIYYIKTFTPNTIYALKIFISNTMDFYLAY